MRAPRFASCAAILVLAQASVPACAQIISCSKFLHNRDGSWSSFVEADVLGNYGLVHVHPGERFSVGRSKVLRDLAQILDGMCRSE